MTEFKIQTSELANNRSMKIPVCFCIEMPSDINDRLEFNRIERSLSSLINKIETTDALKYSVDYCVIFFRENTVIKRRFAVGGSRGPIALETMTGEPNLRKALTAAVKEFQLREMEYQTFKSTKKPSILLLLSSGKTSQPLDEMADQMVHLSNRDMNVVPILMGNGSDAVLRELTYDHTVYSAENGIEGIFDLLGKSIQSMSESSKDAIVKLSNSIDWEAYKRKAKR